MDHDNTNALADAYQKFTPGSQGFCIYVETHCGYEISRTEIERIADRAPNAAEFDRVWQQESGWYDSESPSA